mgnify:CR=1 FL=1|tara:strand:- start:7689 stop:9932 length:2244 start_codon:yes stop_codon:yes gene_type:complete
MALSKQDEVEINKILGRTPSTVEYYIFDTMWSEHCSYKSSKSTLKQLPTKGSEVALGIGEDSGIIRFANYDGKQYCLAISHESHNHPSQILPIEGAATGVGGCVRDVYCMGADVIGVLNSLHFGVPSSNQSIVDEIAEKVVLGISDYGNPLGVPVLGGETLYHKSYNDNCLVNVAAIGLLTEDEIIHSYVPKKAKNEPYDVILVGKPTDATGFGGASFSSATLDDDDQMTNLGAVQVHDPFLKRVLVEAIKELLKTVKEKNIEIGFKDLGAGGISCATSEIAVGGGFGITVNLDKVNIAIPNLAPEIIACSETQERFCIAVPRHFSNEVLDIFNRRFDIPTLYPNGGAAVIGEITQDNLFIMTYKNKEICHLPVECITTEVKAIRTATPRQVSSNKEDSNQLKSSSSIQEICNVFLSQLNNRSKRYVYRYFDNAVQGNTVIFPGEADAVVTTPVPDSNLGLAVSMDSNLYGEYDPYVSGAGAVAESIRNVISVGARPIALTDCLNYGNPEKPNVFFDFQEGVRGIKEAAEALSMIDNDPVPIISGNVSFYNESKQGSAVVPSPVICCMGKVDDINQSKTMQCFDPNLELILVGKRHNEFAGTQIQQYLENKPTIAPQVRLTEEANQNKAILALIRQDLVSIVHDISVGGVFQSISEMILGERGIVRAGVRLKLSDENLVSTLFSENGGYIIATNQLVECQKYLEKHNCSYETIGITTIEKKFFINTPKNNFEVEVENLVEQFNSANP